MDVLIKIKEIFYYRALSFNKLTYKKIFLLSTILLCNIIYLFIIGMGYLKNISVVTPRMLNIIFSAISITLFFIVLKNDLYNTFKINNKQDIKNTIVYANITFIISYVLYYFYNYFMTIMRTPLGGDVQHIKEIAKIDWFNYATLICRYLFSLLNEELIIISTFLILISLFKSNKIKNTIIAMLGALIFFGFLHYITWNVATIPAVIISKLPASILFIFFKDIKPLYIAHLFNNSYVSLLTVAGVTSMMRTNVLIIFLLPLIFYLIYNTLENNFFNNKA